MAILVRERLWPALLGIDSSSGSLGNAVGKTVHELSDILLANLQVHMAPDQGEAGPELQQEALDVAQ